MMFTILRCVGEAVVHKGVAGLAAVAIPFGGALYDIAQDALERYRRYKRQENFLQELRQEVQALVQAEMAEVRQQVRQIAEQVVPADTPPQQQKQLELYLIDGAVDGPPDLPPSTVHKRDNYTCQYCACHVANEGTLDHIIPRSQGGQTTWENVVLACVNCNAQKANRRPEEAYRGKGQPDWHPIKAPNGWKGPSPMRLLSKPEKPKMSLFKGERRYYPKSWDNFISEAYWTVELENDINKDEK